MTYIPKDKRGGKIVEPFLINGIPHVTLVNKEGKEDTLSLAEIVAKTFVPNPENFKFVKHKDGDLENCAALKQVS